MLRTNLSTRPFYNLRAVQAGLAALAATVAIVTAFNLVQIVRLTISQRSLGASAAAAESEAGRLRREAAAMRSRINPRELQVVSAEAREANAIIDQRAFSWTELFTQFEATLPDDVRITAVQPRVERDGSFVVAVAVQARSSHDLDAFVEALEMTGTFQGVLPIEEQTNDDGLLEAIIEGAYVAAPREVAANRE